MAIEDSAVVDAMGVENGTGWVVLTIADGWDWTDERAHLCALQAKLNAYFGFVESGRIWESYPAAQGRRLVIDVITRFPLPASGRVFLEEASQVASQLDVGIRHRVCEGTQE